ncbi:F-box protein At2g26160-like [Lycium barbarum]|uniref:F-box protein At2g26160-like n=1 Tax=Lycium barbarum TaxID=112863 RepID=UPI00293EDA8D|nr:F-box protein At2g26160-like [Lycium barbarum]XP_060204687.1 F-box protein At2g26160-like [Lycium barbarum]XP_060204689.1 F-box protein At2g26160-like [Lycium barbarum]XP_060204690.1 F-box protein At2g26160-like [Lycium barbarum]XP_060204691.1 F-box protein At2g26160-like [Lycium barbarum]
MSNWSELQYDLLVLIGTHINLIEDYLNYAAVCKSWRCAATKDNFNSDLPRIPWLMLAEEEDNKDDGNSCRKFFSLYNGMILKKRIPKASGKRCMESMGWLITVGQDESASLLHPFSGVQIELPHPNTTEDYERHRIGEPWNFFHKAVLSASPSHTSDYVLMVIEGNMKFVSFWRPGDLRWTRINYRNYYHIHRDIIYCTGKFYAVDCNGVVLVYDVTNSSPTQILAELPEHHGGDQCYILESMGSLFVVVRYGVKFRPIKGGSDRIPLTPMFDDEETYGTTSFGVFEVDLAAEKLNETKELGDRALFLGANTSLSVQASQFPGVKPNHIYYTDDYWESYLHYVEGGGLDMGVFNLANGSFEPHYNGVSLSRFCPPIWVTPTLY